MSSEKNLHHFCFWQPTSFDFYMVVLPPGTNQNFLPHRLKKIESSWPALRLNVLVTCKNEDDRFINEDFSHYKSMGIFPDAQGQLTPQSLVRSSRISNSSEMLLMFSLPASMKKIRSKMKALECSQHFPHYNPMGAIRCHGHQSYDPSWLKT